MSSISSALWSIRAAHSSRTRRSLFSLRLSRPRERVNRPQTRRRRENNDESLEKLRMIRENITRALDLFEYLVKRENRKRDLVVSLGLGFGGEVPPEVGPLGGRLKGRCSTASAGVKRASTAPHRSVPGRTQFMETDSQQLQLKLRHWPKLVDEAVRPSAAVWLGRPASLLSLGSHARSNRPDPRRSTWLPPRQRFPGGPSDLICLQQCW